MKSLRNTTVPLLVLVFLTLFSCTREIARIDGRIDKTGSVIDSLKNGLQLQAAVISGYASNLETFRKELTAFQNELLSTFLGITSELSVYADSLENAVKNATGALDGRITEARHLADSIGAAVKAATGELDARLSSSVSYTDSLTTAVKNMMVLLDSKMTELEKIPQCLDSALVCIARDSAALASVSAAIRDIPAATDSIKGGITDARTRIGTLEADLKLLAEQVTAINNEVQKLDATVQSVSFVSMYKGGGAGLVWYPDESGKPLYRLNARYLTLEYKVQPAESIMNEAKNWKEGSEVFRVYARTVLTKSSLTELPVTKVLFDNNGNGLLTIEADCSSVTDILNSSGQSISVCLEICTGNTLVSSSFVDVGNVPVRTEAADAADIPFLMEDDSGKPAAFSVAPGRKVKFTKGNLTATWTGYGYRWGAASLQLYYMGPNNSHLEEPHIGETFDLFGWSTPGSYYGLCASTNESDYSGDFVDWGKLFQGQLRTLTKEEWAYLFEETSRGELRFAVVNILGRYGCLIIPDGWKESDWPLSYFPDSFNHFGAINTHYYNNSHLEELEKRGVVFLPFGGQRNGLYYEMGTSAYGTPSFGHYWTSTITDSHSYCMKLCDGISSFAKHTGLNVRLVADY